MIVNPIYFSSGSNLGNGENDWDPTDIKENKEMLDLTDFKPCTVVTGTYFTLFADASSVLLANDNTTLILQLINTNTGYDQEIFMCASTTIPSTSLDSIEGTQIKFYCLKSTNVFYKIKLPSVYRGQYIKFSGMSGRVNIYAWYKKE